MVHRAPWQKVARTPMNAPEEMLSKYIKQPVKLTKWIAIGFFENESCIKQTVFQVYLCDSKW